MPGFDHKPHHGESEPQNTRHARFGMILFAIYLLLYAGFVGLNAFRPSLMDIIPFAGINLAILYGLGLIVSAFVLALIYGWLCRTIPDESATREDRP